ncbi:type VII secretion protein EccC [Rhodococcus sp. MEB064]|uniref:type VII secretion protein EccC n=1 Tax=Rhodococcus sp. MEB064 TaxID=1587522 RepID=UPI0005ABF2E7|nr:type VII secretion protein EccC [Rhodococcus sp. MEB064]KIQ17199.1 secretion protein EccC [Rhodococcus sp. MEB064]
MQRSDAPRVPSGVVEIEAPPEIPRVVPGDPLLKMLPLVMVVAMVGMVALLVTSGAAANPMMLLFPAMMVVSMLGMFAGGGRGGGPRAAELDESRKDYLTYLSELRRKVRATGQAQSASLAWTHPDPSTLWTLVGTTRMWERRAADDDFVHVRVGVGDQRLATRLVSPDTGPQDGLEPVSASSLRSFVRNHSIVRNLPTAVSLRAFSCVRFEGDDESSRALLRSMMLQACLFHGPDDVAVVVIVGPDAITEWDWVKWLPHHRNPAGDDGAGARRSTYRTVADASVDVDALLHGHVLVVVDGTVPDAAELTSIRRAESTTVFDLGGFVPPTSDERTLVLVLQDGALGAHGRAGVEMFGLADGVDPITAATVARTLARYRTSSDNGRTDAAAPVYDRWERLPGMSEPGSFDPATSWAEHSGRARLRVPFGTDEHGRVVELDLKESAEGGMGPHGLCIGATGSGKSELLRTVVLGLLATHSPSELNVVLVDFKGGATFLGLDSAPHVAAVITNLSEEAGMVERMRDALAGEMNRRQELLRSAGNFANVSDYTRARLSGAPLAPLPALFVVVDEFSELLSRFPEFADLFVAIGRLGRSLHIHLLLASQRLDEGRLRGLDSHLSYRIGLKTFSAAESRSVLGVPDAHHLTGGPGAGYLKTDSSDLVRFTASYVSGPCAHGGPLGDSRGAAVSTSGASAAAGIRLFTAVPVAHDDIAPAVLLEVPEQRSGHEAPTVLSAVVAGMVGHGTAAHQVWLPPLDDPIALGSVVVPFEPVSPTSLCVPFAVVDRPYDQRRDTLALDLTGAAGHVAIVGGPHSGKSTAVCTLVLSLALRYSPSDVQIHCLDFGGGSVGRLRELPHVGSVATRSDTDTVRRIVADVAATLRRRETLFRERAIGSMAEVRRGRATSSADVTAPAMPDVPDLILVIDGWQTIRAEFESLEPALQTIVSTGLSYGVHVVIAASRWAEIRPAIKDAVTTRVELRMGDPSDSDIGRARAAGVPEGRPGRGMTREGLHLLVALPRIDRVGDSAGGTGSAIADVARHWAHVSPAPTVQLLPRLLARGDLLAAMPSWPPASSTSFTATVPVGVDEDDLAPVLLNLDENPHFIVLGDGRCGKTTLLRTVCAGLVDANDASSLRILMIDYRRTLLGDIPDDRLAGHASSGEQATAMVAELSTYLRLRLPGPDTTREQLTARSWWTGPDIVVIVDDYDLVVTPHGNPLSELLDLLSRARDIGLHVIVARRSGGAARAMYEPVLARLRDLASPGIVMSGNREEGVLLGTARPTELPTGRGVLTGRGTATLVQTALTVSA